MHQTLSWFVQNEQSRQKQTTAFSKSADPITVRHHSVPTLGSAYPHRSRAPHQQHQRWAADQGNGCGEFPLIAPTVGAGQAVPIERQAQALNTPVCHLGKRKTSKHLRPPPIQSLGLPDLTYLARQSHLLAHVLWHML